MSNQDFDLNNDIENNQWEETDSEDWDDWDPSWDDGGNWGDECGDEEDEIPIPLTQRVPVGGTTVKWKPAEFEGIKRNLATVFGNEKLLGFVDGTDCTVIEISEVQSAAFTLDWFPSMTDNEYAFGAISAAGSLSKLYATGVKPITALNIMALPCKLGVESVGDVMKGGSDKVIEAGAFVVGGHSIDDAEPKYGLACFGLAHPSKIIHNENAKPGDALFCTKPLGTGILDAAFHDQAEDKESMSDAIAVMMELNKAAAEAMEIAGAHAATAISESGLLGHLQSILLSSDNAAEIKWDAIPLLERTYQRSKEGYGTDRSKKTAEWISNMVEMPGVDNEERDIRMNVLCDPQTSGGLIVAVPAENAEVFAKEFEERSGHTAAQIGVLHNGEAGHIIIH